ncbi:uncharacterized protein LOC117169868 [Belonocnema kinseyi]|uniref:uncharacterized protein LOC117169868 n=1 Tax=Belonocnema kinseyi TaxID=2817044 RepID=UPI00143DA3CE|nr:uncharacterized protein LOC117169868 [Belonocnema kinseyi]
MLLSTLCLLRCINILKILHGSAKIDMVRRDFKRFFKIISIYKEKTGRRTATKNLVERYQNAIEYARKIEYIYSYQLFIHVVLSMLAICATGFTVIVLLQEDSLQPKDVIKIIKCIMFFFAAFWITGVYCAGGDYLRCKERRRHVNIQFRIFGRCSSDLG